ncbi:hypothetical protein BDW02DRAFT_650637 [Decorospora gaudefroyi]|uniref:SAM-dependent MTase RsmB/NOP-type domain-containing protein n=1 Tax=Decorospora gaudefroyi TaxID=184978 RepID=A0A6A5KAQ7_9PLEO|nr:hypothetical protein BDW02DRAFT_650637 [Decorospora gaudefroyi]
MSLYYEAAAILANSDNIGGSLKSRIYNKKDLKSTPGQLFALIAESSKWSVVLKDVIEKCRLLAEERKLTPILALLLTHDLLLAKKGVAAPATHVLKLAITRHKARLSAELTKVRIRHGYATLDAFREAVNDGELDKEDGDAVESRHPRWVRVNTLKTTLQEQLATTFAGFVQTEDIDEVLRAPKKAKMYYEDPNIPNLLALPSKIDLSKTIAYAKGQIIFQDKASCFPAYLLDPTPENGYVIDATAAPGNKTTHLAAIVSERRQAGEGQKVIAFERDKGRTFTLQKMVKLASADSIVQVKGSSDFIAAKPGSDEFANVGAILLDPSCSGTGIVGRDDAIKMHLPEAPGGLTIPQKPEKGKKRKRGDEPAKSETSATLDLDMDDSTAEETPLHGKLSERLAALSSFQLHILTHAMRFENAHKITYSTCSIHFEENEGVVLQALASSVAKERGWTILKREQQVDGLRKWHRRGVCEDEKVNSDMDVSYRNDVLEACIRCDKGTEEGTMGFFVAAFVRQGLPGSVKGIEEGEEWDGFSDDHGEGEVISANPPAANGSGKRKKKKRKVENCDRPDMGSAPLPGPSDGQERWNPRRVQQQPFNCILNRFVAPILSSPHPSSLLHGKRVAHRAYHVYLDLRSAHTKTMLTRMPPIRGSTVSSQLTESPLYLDAPQPNIDLSRPRLKQLARWIRDELDLSVAREGPDILRPDDVLTLHETFIALRHAQNISLSDLRATRIHRAVQDIAGVATRWPGRLCDDCDKIITIWTAKFGPLSEIHPFLFGRGGRLEGIASIHEYSREALLKRWTETCPEKIHPKRSHRLGDLGFTAGAWWINPLFAHHAGIIGLESCEGGTTYDKHGAYALLLKDTGELEASSEERFTYRVTQKDKGKFRLTSATPKSREPVRVLRSHSINSVWGPKAGVRYEGLYSVKGWSIKQAKSSDIAGGQWSHGDIIFDVKFERKDPVPMEEVTKRPTATEVDDYTEYKRLRKVGRDGNRKASGAPSRKIDFQTVAKHAPPIAPPQAPGPGIRPPQRDSPPNALRPGLFKHPQFDEEAHVHVPTNEDVISPKTISDEDPLPQSVVKSNKLVVPAKPSTQGKGDTSSNDSRGRVSPAGSNASSAHTAISTIRGIDIREVAPWVDYDAGLTMPSLPVEDTLIVHERPIITQSATIRDDKDAKSAQGTPQSSFYGPIDSPGPQGEHHLGGSHKTRKSGEFKGAAGLQLSPASSKRNDRKSVLVRIRNPVAKRLDGADLDDESFGWDGQAVEGTFLSAEPISPDVMQRGRPISVGDMPDRTLSPVPFGLDSPFTMGRRDAICPGNDYVSQLRDIICLTKNKDFLSRPPATTATEIISPVDYFVRHPSAAPITRPLGPTTAFLPRPQHKSMPEDPSTPMVVAAITHDDPFIEAPIPRRAEPKPMPMAMKNLISQTKSATSVRSPVSTPPVEVERTGALSKDAGDDSVAEQKLKKMLQQIQALKVNVVFRDPWGGSPVRREREGGGSDGFAPEEQSGSCVGGDGA